MKERDWHFLILGVSIVLYTTLGIIFNDIKISMAIGIFGGMGTGFLMFTFSMKYDERQYEQESKKLEKENKYRKTINCSNCGRSHYFTPVKGVCMMEFLIDKKCENCQCELRKTEKVE